MTQPWNQGTAATLKKFDSLNNKPLKTATFKGYNNGQPNARTLLEGIFGRIASGAPNC
jgi:hypothetical protein